MDFRIEARAYDHPDVARLVAAVQAEYVVRYGGPDETAVDAAQFRPPEGLFLLGVLDGDPVVSGGWRRMADGVVEIKRMYVLGAARRRGLARLMLAELEASAGAAGARRIELNTGDQQPEAIALYRSSGYLPTGAFGFYKGTPGAKFYGKDLLPDGVSASRQ